MSIGSQRDVAVTVIQQPTETKADSFGPGEGMLPLVVHEPCGIQPGLGLGVEAAIRPGLMRVPGQQQPFRHAEAAVVVCDGIG